MGSKSQGFFDERRLGHPPAAPKAPHFSAPLLRACPFSHSPYVPYVLYVLFPIFLPGFHPPFKDPKPQTPYPIPDLDGGLPRCGDS